MWHLKKAINHAADFCMVFLINFLFLVPSLLVLRSATKAFIPEPLNATPTEEDTNFSSTINSVMLATLDSLLSAIVIDMVNHKIALTRANKTNRNITAVQLDPQSVANYLNLKILSYHLIQAALMNLIYSTEIIETYPYAARAASMDVFYNRAFLPMLDSCKSSAAAKAISNNKRTQEVLAKLTKYEIWEQCQQPFKKAASIKKPQKLSW